MTAFRPARNGDLPELAALWNRGLPRYGTALELTPREFDDAICSRLFFERSALIVALESGRIAGFAHAGFGPDEPEGPGQALDRSIGCIAMVHVAPEAGDEVAVGLIEAACRTLREAGAEVLYAGGRAPVNPFYWGVYGGSEFSGILGEHHRFRMAAEALNFRPCARSILLEAGVSGSIGSAFDPRSLLLRRTHHVVQEEEALHRRWWDALALRGTESTHYRIDDGRGTPIARASTWDMVGFERVDGLPRVGLIDVDVDPAYRRRGLGRHLLRHIIRHQSERGIAAICVQTDESNEPALALYRSLGFESRGESILYRLDPAGTASAGSSRPPATPQES